jgi:ATP-dependent Clp endopeptidase proteolytic subunit ClpP
MTDAKPWYRIENLASSGSAEVYIYDEISPWGITADSFVQELRAIAADKIDLHINSPGGDVFDAVAIYQGLRNHPAEVTVYVDSLAASSASFIAMAGDRRIIGPHGTLMIHDAWGFAMGNAADMAKLAGDLDRVSDNIASIYASRSGGDVATWREAMRAETWYSATEAVAVGLMDEVQKDEKAAKEPALNARFDLSVFNFAGRSKAPAPANLARRGRPAGRRAAPRTPGRRAGARNHRTERGGPSVRSERVPLAARPRRHRGRGGHHGCDRRVEGEG